MKQPRVIQRLSSLVLAFMLLFSAVWSQSGSTQQQVLGARKAAVEHSKTGKAQSVPQDEVQLSVAGFEAVSAPAITIDGGGQTIFLLPAPALIILLLLSILLLRDYAFPHYYFSYFRHVFGHVIAPNAP